MENIYNLKQFYCNQCPGDTGHNGLMLEVSLGIYN